jgi:TusA-related sulfurtransferase
VAEERIEDARGLLCPLPVIKLADCIRCVPGGGTVVLLADDPVAEQDVNLWSRSHGHEVVDVRRDEGFLRIRVRRRLDPA